MTVSNFLNAGKAAELIDYKKGEPPQRIIDYVPPSWIELVKNDRLAWKQKQKLKEETKDVSTV